MNPRSRSPLSLRTAALILLLLILTFTAVSQSQPDAQPLLPNQTLEREMTGAETHRYKFDLKAGEFFQVRVEQKGVDVALRLLDSVRNTLATMDSPNSKEGPETLSFAAEKTAAEFILEVVSIDTKTENGKYTIKREPSRTATERDKRRVDLERLFVRGMAATTTLAERETALETLKRALAGWKELEETYLVDLTAHQVKQLEASLGIAAKLNELNDELKKGQAVLKQGYALPKTSYEEVMKARGKFEEALTIYLSLEKKIADDSFRQTILRSGKEAFYELEKSEMLSKFGISISYSAIANTYRPFGEWEQNIENLKKAIEAARAIVENQSFRENKSFPKEFFISNTSLIAQDLDLIAGVLDNKLGQIEQSIKYRILAVDEWKGLFVITQDSKYEFEAATAFVGLGQTYSRQSKDRQIAVKYLNEAISIYQKHPDKKRRVAEALYAISGIYLSDNDYLSARNYLQKALEIYLELNDKQGQSEILERVAAVYWVLDDKPNAEKYFRQTLEILESPDFVENRKIILQAESGHENFWDDNFEGLVQQSRFTAIGFAYYFIEIYPKALDAFGKALKYSQSSKQVGNVDSALSAIGMTLAKQEKWDEAFKYYKQVYDITSKLNSKEDIASAAIDVGRVLFELGKFDEALRYQNESLSLFKSVGVDEDKAFHPSFSSLLVGLSRTHYALGKKPLAIFLGKRAVNAMQGERQRLQNLDPVSQKGFLEKKEKHYRRLADWLIESGRLVEAEQVLAMLKEEEVGDYLRRDMNFAEKLSLRIDFTPTEKAAMESYQKNAETISAIGGEFSKLEDLQRGGVKLSDEQEKRFAELRVKLTGANVAFQNFLSNLAEEFPKAKDPIEDSKSNKAIQGKLRGWGEGVVYIYTLVGKERFSSVLYTPNAAPETQQAYKSSELNQKIFAFREAVKNPNIDPRPLGKELYDILIKPFEVELDAAKARTILWSLDGNLRLLPLAAMWDGKEYFGQKYQNVVITPVSHFNLGDQVSTDLNVLGLGVSESKTVPETLTERRFVFGALPSVPFELSSIVKTKNSPKGVLPGASFLDGGFTKKSFAEQLLKGYKIIHIASHFSMNAGDASRSFLLLGDGSVLTVNDLNTDAGFSSKFEGVELLTLSACETAVGETDSNGKEVEGFAYVMQQNGAKSILATLWSVADESTALLMSEFYHLRKQDPKLSKAAAMQQAQQAMITGKLKSSGNQTGCRAEIVRDPQKDYKCNANAPFAHPYYWAPFVLIGNWR